MALEVIPLGELHTTGVTLEGSMQCPVVHLKGVQAVEDLLALVTFDANVHDYFYLTYRNSRSHFRKPLDLRKYQLIRPRIMLIAF